MIARAPLVKWPVFIIWLVVSCVLIFFAREQIAIGEGLGPDDQMRVAQLRDWLGGQSWFDTSQYRLNGPEGVIMHWPRLIELPLALCIFIASPFLGPENAEIFAMVLVPLIGLGLAMLLIAKITHIIAEQTIAYVAVALTSVSLPIIIQLRPMRIDHHGWQIVLALFVLWTMLWPNRKKGGAFMGAALALWLQISLEGLPLSVAFIILLGWRWLFNSAEGVRLFWTLASFGVTSLILYLLVHGGFSAAVNYCDSISPAHLLAVFAGGAIMLTAIGSRADNVPMRIGAMALAGAVSGAIFYWQAPQCASGAFAELDPLVRTFWFENVQEGMPVWQQDITIVLHYLLSPLIGLFALASMMLLMHGKKREDLFIVGYALIWAFVVSLFVQRAAAVTAAYALPAGAWLIATMFVRSRSLATPVQRILAAVVTLLLVVPGPIAVAIADKAMVEDSEAVDEKLLLADGDLGCDDPRSIAKLAALPTGKFIAPFSMGPMILTRTEHNILASSHHRNHNGMRDQIRIFTEPAEDAFSILQGNGIDYIAACPTLSELELYADNRPKGLWKTLSEGKAVAGLTPIAIEDSKISVWRVAKK